MPIKVAVGLGNPGQRYATTRHNVGRRVLEALEADKPDGLALFVPDSYMNESGGPVAEFVRRKGIKPDQILLISDDFELPLGTLRIRRGGSSGGHNGLKSVFEALGTQEIPRLRVGIGPVAENEDPKEYVLRSFTKKEEGLLKSDVIPRAAEAVRRAVAEGLEKAMNEFNTKTA